MSTHNMSSTHLTTYRAQALGLGSPFLGAAGIQRNSGFYLIGMCLALKRIKVSDKSPFHLSVLSGLSFSRLSSPFHPGSKAGGFAFTIGAHFSDDFRTTRNTFILTRNTFVPRFFASGTKDSITARSILKLAIEAQRIINVLLDKLLFCPVGIIAVGAGVYHFSKEGILSVFGKQASNNTRTGGIANPQIGGRVPVESDICGARSVVELTA